MKEERILIYEIMVVEIKDIILDKRYRISKGLEMRICGGKRKND